MIKPLILLLIASFAIAIYKLQFFIIYPSSFPAGSRSHVDSPKEYDMEFLETKIFTSDGEALQTYLLTPPVQNVKKTVLLLGPNAGNIGMELPLAKILYSAGYNVVLISYRGYGKSTGSPSEHGIKIDGRSALEFIKNHEVLGSTQLVLYGRSLGGAVAVYLASLYADQVHSVILENTFLSIPKLVPILMPVFSVLRPFITQKWRSENTILSWKNTPVLFLGGEKDEIVPFEHFKKLFELCPSSEKQFKSFPNGTHNDTVIQIGYFDALLEFLRRP